MKVAVVTPYHREELATLRRCHESVLRQTHKCTHILVADGHPRAEVAQWEAQHLVLAVAHGDCGNTPRGIGSITALNQGFDAVAYLDADNWYAEDHVESLVSTCRSTGAAVAFSSRKIVLSTGGTLPFVETDEVEGRHVDTSCFFITARAASLLPIWAMMDQSAALVGDRLMLSALRTRGIPHAWTGRPTLFYETRWAGHYRDVGLAPPPEAKELDLAQAVAAYSPERQIERLGFDPVPQISAERARG